MWSERDQYGVAWMVSSIYERILWPMGIFLFGFMGGSIIWAAIATVPLLMISYGLDRSHQYTNDRPATKLNSFAIVMIILTIMLFGLYYFGLAISHMWMQG
jgi:uncharacterized membrane protein